MLLTYYNLSQCVGERMVYFRSTDVEQRNYHRLLWSVPDEWLYHLSQGNQIKLIDKSTNRGKVGFIFIPVLNDLINLLARTAEPVSGEFRAHFFAAYEALMDDEMLHTKFKFWAKRITRQVCIQSETIHIEREENPMEVLI